MPQIVIWKLGSLEHRVLPTEMAMATLADMLNRWDGKETLHLVWGPDIEAQVIDVETDAIKMVVPTDIEVRKDGDTVIISRKN